MAKDKVATIKGTFLIPTISKNKRAYTENIGKAVERMNVRLQSSQELPLTMFPSHGTADADNALMTIGRVTKVTQEADGSGTFEADIADTTAGRDMAALVTPANPYIKGLSIRGQWMSQPISVETEDGSYTTADDLDVFGIDWTGRPGVEGAQITQAALAESVGAENMIFESADGELFFDETADEPNASILETVDHLRAAADALEAGNAPGNGKLPYGDTTYADPGYQKDKKKRYPIDTAAHVRAAWSYINKETNSGAYSSAQLARIKSKIKSAAKKFKINIAEESAQLESDIQELLEAYASMCIDNGAGSVSTSGYTDDGGKLAPMARRIAMAAIIGLNALDPDADGDIDLLMPDGSIDSSSSKEAQVADDNDNDMSAPNCSECGSDLPENALFCPTCAAPVPNAESGEEPTTAEPQIETAPIENKEAPVADETQTATAETQTSTDAVVTPVTEAAVPATVTLTSEQFQALLGAVAAKPVEAAPVEAEPVEEAKPLTQADLEAAVEAMRVETELKAVEAIRAAGIIPRTGYVSAPTGGMGGATPLTAKEAPSLAELAKMSEDDFFNNTAEALNGHPGWRRIAERADARASY